MTKSEFRYAAMIEEQFPEVNIQTVKSLGEGFRNYAILVNEEWVFRFPKSRQGADELTKEIQLLPLLADHVKVGIPAFEYIGKRRDGRPFVGYRKVQGEILGEDGVTALSDIAIDRLAFQLASFMSDLSSFPLDTAIRAGVPVRNIGKELRSLFESAEKLAFPLLNPSLRYYVTARFRSYLEHPEYARYTPALIHGDLSPDHFLMDTTRSALTGIIDFGDTAILDPDYDYVYLLEDCGEPFTRKVMGYRGVVDPDARIGKASLFVTFDQVSYLLEGLAAGDRGWISEGLEVLEHDMRINRKRL